MKKFKNEHLQFLHWKGVLPKLKHGIRYVDSMYNGTILINWTKSGRENWKTLYENKEAALKKKFCYDLDSYKNLIEIYGNEVQFLEWEITKENKFTITLDQKAKIAISKALTEVGNLYKSNTEIYKYHKQLAKTIENLEEDNE